VRNIILVVVAVVGLFPHMTLAEDEPISGRHILAVAKVAGVCGILDSLIQFQAETKMPGGDGFVTRFWSVEAARRGMTVRQVSDQCNAAVSTYDAMWKASGSNEP